MSATTKLVWLGTGSATNPVLGNTSFYLHGDGPRILLVDCGTTVFPKSLELRLVDRVTDIVLTHHHSDHIGGLEAFGFYSYFILRQTGHNRPCLHLATETFAETLWERALRAGMGRILDSTGQPVTTTLETYFRVSIADHVSVEGLPKIHLVATPHVDGMENYALRLGTTAYYSGDTTALPPNDPSIIFQDCQFNAPRPDDIHISYETLNRELSAEVKSKTYLVHLDPEWRKYHPTRSGFAGFVMPGQEFVLRT